MTSHETQEYRTLISFLCIMNYYDEFEDFVSLSYPVVTKFILYAMFYHQIKIQLITLRSNLHLLSLSVLLYVAQIMINNRRMTLTMYFILN